MDKKSLALCIGVLIVCFGMIGVGELLDDTENAEGNNVVSEVQEENTIKENPKTNDTSNNEVESMPAEEPEKLEENLTVDNCEDLANIMKVDNGDELLKSFAEKYDDKIIEFDGNIAYMTKHGDYKTRYDILLYVGDYDEDKGGGPSFRLIDVNTYDLGINELFMPAFVDMGANVRASIRITGYNEKTGMILVKPVLIQPRENSN